MSFPFPHKAVLLGLALLCLATPPVAALDWRYRPGVDGPLLPEKDRLPPEQPYARPPGIPDWMQDRSPEGGVSAQSFSIGPSSEALDEQEERTAVALANQSVNENLTASHDLPGKELLPGPLQTPVTLNFGIRYEF